jgi:CheY-like chemotaxis protein
MDMPEESGAEVARRIRNTRGSQDIPLVLVSSSTRVPPDSEVAGLFQGILNKPVRSALFYETLSRALRAHVEPIDAKDEDKNKSLALRGVRVLVVEDNPINQLVVTEMLKTWGCSVVAVDNGRKAVDRTVVDKFHLVLMDVQMPEMDGLEATQAIRAREAKTGDHLPIIAMTANAMRGDEERCIQAGMDLYLSKPIEPKKMMAAMSQFLQGPIELIDVEEKPKVKEEVPYFDINQLDQSTSGKVSLQVQVLGRYSEGLSSQLARLTDAIQINNRQDVRSISHSLKGSSFTVGAIKLADVFRRLEAGAENLPSDTLGMLLHEAEDAAFETRNSIQARLDQIQHATQ